MDITTTSKALQAVTPFKIKAKHLNAMVGAGIVLFIGYNIANYHYSIKLNRLRIEQEKRDLDSE
jgi:hypothetical protein